MTAVPGQYQLEKQIGRDIRVLGRLNNGKRFLLNFDTRHRDDEEGESELKEGYCAVDWRWRFNPGDGLVRSHRGKVVGRFWLQMWIHGSGRQKEHFQFSPWKWMDPVYLDELGDKLEEKVKRMSDSHIKGLSRIMRNGFKEGNVRVVLDNKEAFYHVSSQDWGGAPSLSVGTSTLGKGSGLIESVASYSDLHAPWQQEVCSLLLQSWRISMYWSLIWAFKHRVRTLAAISLLAWMDKTPDRVPTSIGAVDIGNGTVLYFSSRDNSHHTHYDSYGGHPILSFLEQTRGGGGLVIHKYESQLEGASE